MAPLSLYLDTSVVVPLFLPDPFVPRARHLLSSQMLQAIVSDFVAAEFCSVVGRRLRNKELTPAAARAAFANFDTWCGRYASTVETGTADIQTAKLFLRRLDLTLRTPDAISLAIAQRLGVELATFDDKMAASARKLGISLARV